jgi:DNA polymerase-3 subunit gamma/tau
LDQAISLGGGEVKTDVVKNMIGLADRGLTFELFENLVAGKIEAVVANLDAQHKEGANPLTLLQDLINITHMLAKVQIVPETINDSSLSENEKEFCKRIAPQVSIVNLSKIWQMLIKGLSELNIAPLQNDALEMILIRIAYSASLPSPAEILDGLKKNSDLGQITRFTPQTAGYADSVHSEDNKTVLNTPEDLVQYLLDNKKVMMAYSLKNDISFAEFGNGKMSITVSEKISSEFLLNLQNILTEATGQKWDAEILRGALGETLADKEAAKDRESKKDIMDLPLVKAVLAEFKGAKIESLTRKISEEEPAEEYVGNTMYEDNNYNDEDN